MRKYTERTYDTKRKKESRQKLLSAITSLSGLAEHRTNPITKTELSKKTGISRATIDRYPEVLERLEEVNSKIRCVAVKEYVSIDVDRVSSIEEAKALLVAMTALFNEREEDIKNKDKQIDDLRKAITTRDSEIAKLMTEKNEMKQYINSLNG